MTGRRELGAKTETQQEKSFLLMLPLGDNRRSQLKSVKCHIDEYERGKVEGLREEGEYSIITVYAIVHDAVTK